jgi:hypothetical protein
MRRTIAPITIGALAAWAWLAFFSAAGFRSGASGYTRPAFAQERAAARTIDFDKLVEKVPVGDVLPARCIIDPYAEFNGIAVDPVNDVVVMTAPNIRSLMLYSVLPAAQMAR